MMKTTPTLSAAAVAALISILWAAPSIGATAAENYAFYCAQCHGVGGKGDGPNAVDSNPVSPRDHTNPSEMSKLTDEDLIAVMTDGGAATSKSTLMPPFAKTLTRAEIAALKDHLRKLCKCKGK